MKKRIILSLLLILVTYVNLLAQDPGSPCGGMDEDGSCPIDSWVMLLAACALIATVLFLRHKSSQEQKYNLS